MIQPDQEPQWMSAGDVFLLTDTPAYVIASDPDLPASDGLELSWQNGDTVCYNGSDTVLLAGSYALDPLHARLLSDALPAFMHIRASDSQASDSAATMLRHTLEILDSEIRNCEMGQDMVARHLADILLVLMLRTHAAQNARGTPSLGWIGALSDKRIGKVLNLMHGDLAHRWSVGELARIACMSRSAFSHAFKIALGKPPLDYMLCWRMQVATGMLVQGHRVAQVAQAVGYSSESAFGNAYKRIHGHSPKKAVVQHRDKDVAR